MKSPFSFDIEFLRKPGRSKFYLVPSPSMVFEDQLQVCEELGPRQQDPNKDGV